MGVTSRMFAANLLIAMLVVSSQAAHFQESEKALLEEDRFSPQFVLDLLIGLITDIIRDQILNILGITTTQATPILDALNDVPVIGALIPDKPTPTTTTTPTTTKCGGLFGGGLLGC